MTRPLNRTEAGVDLVMIPTVLFFECELLCFHHKVNPLSLFHAEARQHFAELLCVIYTYSYFLVCFGGILGEFGSATVHIAM